MRVAGRQWWYCVGCADWVGIRSLVWILWVLPVPCSTGGGFASHGFENLRATERQDRHTPENGTRWISHPCQKCIELKKKRSSLVSKFDGGSARAMWADPLCPRVPLCAVSTTHSPL